jgi:hypothetical protein
MPAISGDHQRAVEIEERRVHVVDHAIYHPVRDTNVSSGRKTQPAGRRQPPFPPMSNSSARALSLSPVTRFKKSTRSMVRQ